MLKFLLVLLVFTLSACEDCSKPTKKVCDKYVCHTMSIYNPVLKMIFPQEICDCIKYIEVPNKCYRENQNDQN